MRYGTWNVRSLYRSGSLTTAARELERYKLDLVGAQKVRWDTRGIVRAADHNFFYGKRNKNHQMGTGFLYTTELYQQLREQSLFVIGCHIVLRGHWCNIFVWNVHALSKKKGDDANYRFMRNLSRFLISSQVL